MIEIFFGIENPLGGLFDWMYGISNGDIQRHRTKAMFNYIREIAEDVEFEEIEIVNENRETEIIIQSIE